MEEHLAVSTAFFIEVDYPTEYFHATAVESIESALSIIDEVHKDGNLPEIPIQVTRLSNVLGMFHAKPRRTASLSGFEISIEIHPASDLVEFDTLHEIGHFLDFSGLDVPQSFASVNSPILAEWRHAIKRSHAVQTLRQMSQLSRMRSEFMPIDLPVNIPLTQYLLDARELWARSYAQYIAAKSGNIGLEQQLNLRRVHPPFDLYYWAHWENNDFVPIMSAIDAAFQQLGWL